jgi:DUF218 domain
MNEEVLRLARIIWDYHWVQQEAAAADVIIALGTNDLRVAEFAADLFLRGYGATLVSTGGVAHQGDLLETSWEKTEAEMYADVAIGRGVPRERILLETQATNTAENIRFARDLLSRLGIRPRNIVLAVKPFMRRRVWDSRRVLHQRTGAREDHQHHDGRFAAHLGLRAEGMVGAAAAACRGPGSLSAAGCTRFHEAFDCGGVRAADAFHPGA